MTTFSLEQHCAARQNPILVPNARLAEAWVTQHYLSENPESGVIIEPPVQTLSEWARGLLQEAQMLAGEDFPALINRQQQLALWESAVAADEELTDDKQIKALAGLAMSAERQLRQWDVYVPEPAVNDQFRSFMRWRARYKQLAHERKLATAEDQIASLTARLDESGFIHLPKQVTLFGFLELTRSEEMLLKQLALCGVDIEYLPLDGGYAPGDCTLLRYSDFDAEIAAAAMWAADALASGAGQVAIVVNDIDRNVGLIRHILEQHFHPDRIVTGQDLRDAHFHIPTGEPFSSQQIVADALLILELSLSGSIKRWPAAKISRFLLSPYTQAAEQEYTDRARLEVHMRKKGYFEASLRDILKWLELDKFKTTAPVLKELLTGLENSNPEATLAQHMASSLQYWGWGQASPGPGNNQSFVSKFLKLIENIAFLRPENSSDALKLINTMCRDTRIATHGGDLSPIQVLSPEAAIGRRFDAARVINMRQDTWPGKPKQNGLIPPVCWHLLGRATVESEFEHASRVTQLLKTLAPAVSFSWTDHDNGVEAPPSALLADLGVPAVAQDPPKTFWQTLYQSGKCQAELEERPEQPGLALDPADNPRLPGGAGLFAEQANAPMAAYCRRRLGAQWWDLPGPFVDAAYRGTVLHSALEYLYMNAIESGNLPTEEQVPGAVKKALNKHQARQKMTPHALSAEVTRLQQLLAQWLTVDLARPQFTPVTLECRETVEWQGFEVGLRIDRVDSLSAGKLMILDYKSGSIDTRGWADERLNNPQLPLYALLYEKLTGIPVSAISLAGVRMNGCAFEGIGEETLESFDGLKIFGGRNVGLVRQFDSWADLRAQWQKQLEVLLAEIRHGHCENRIYNADNLKYWGLDSLLRISEGEHWLSEHGNDAAS